MKRNWSLLPEQMPVYCLLRLRRKFIRIFPDCVIMNIQRKLHSTLLNRENYKNLAKTRYVNDKQITDHYAIVPTGQGLNALRSVSLTAQRVYETIVRRFVCIFYPPAVYQKISLVTKIQNESFFSSFKVLLDEGYLKVATNSFAKRKAADAMSSVNRAGAAGNEGSEEEDPDTGKNGGNKADDSAEDMACDTRLLAALQNLKKVIYSLWTA